jgi:hypothetical protein
VSCAAASLGTTEAARASFTDTATLDRAVVLVTTMNCGAIESDALGANGENRMSARTVLLQTIPPHALMERSQVPGAS